MPVLCLVEGLRVRVDTCRGRSRRASLLRSLFFHVYPHMVSSLTYIITSGQYEHGHKRSGIFLPDAFVGALSQ